MDNVKESWLFPDRERIYCFETTSPGVDPVAWATVNVELLNARLLAAGACLLRGFDVPDPGVFANVVRVFGDELSEYTYRSTPRSKVGDVYTSTEYAASEVIPLHNENSYTSVWPKRIWFYAATASPVGGQTPLADSHAVYRRIPAEVRERFERHGVRYVRNYRAGLGVSWQETFPGMDRAEVERFCDERGIVVEWLDDDSLRTTETCQATTLHPATGLPVWMNQAHLFHVSSLNQLTRSALLELMVEEDLPRNAYFGDGERIEDADLAAVRAAYEAEELVFPWQDGDLLMVDNMAMAHGRRSFSGPRKILVAMTGSHRGRSA